MPGAEMLIQEGLKELSDDARFALDRVFCLQRGSEVATNRGDSHAAVTRAQGAQRALSQSPFRPEVLELDNLIILAGAYWHAGQVREASTAFEQASARLTALGRDNTQRAGTLFNNWGAALWMWGRPLDAERLLRRAIAVGQDSQAEATVSPMVLVNYARTLNELGRLGEAADYAERAYAKAQTAGDQTVANQSLLVRTAIYRNQGDLERAGQMLSEVEPTLRRNLPAGHIAFASLALQRALNAQARGDMQTALVLASQAVAIAEASSREGHLAAGYLERFLVSRSETQLQLGHKDEAAGDAWRAVKMLLGSAQPGTLSSTLGRAYLALGRALQAQGKLEESRSAFRPAVESLESALGPDHAETRSARQFVEAEIRLR